MPARCIKVRDLSELLDKPESHVRRVLSRLGIEIEQYYRQPAVDWQLLVSRLDKKTLHGLEAAAKQSYFDLRRITWTVASFPEVAAYWDQKRNHGVKPSDVTFSSSKKFWWKCDVARDHVWEIAPQSRLGARLAGGTYPVLGCPFCTHHRLTPRDSLAVKCPDIARLWHPRRNGKLTPGDVAQYSKKAVWWQCANGHVWNEAVRARSSGTKSCPYCAGVRLTPANSLASKAPDLAKQWHKTKNGTLKPSDVLCRSEGDVWWKCPAASDHEWQASPGDRVRAPSCPFCSNRRVSKDNCLARKYPTIAREWHGKRNGSLTPYDIVAASGRRVWWKCSKGPDHEWRCRVVNRTQSKSGCPCCSGLQVSVTNSLARKYPTVAREWHRLKNSESSPSRIIGTSTKTAWWKCYRGHEWRAPIRKRTVSHHGCSECEKLDAGRVRRR